MVGRSTPLIFAAISRAVGFLVIPGALDAAAGGS